MKRLLSFMLLAIVTMTLFFTHPAQAADTANGAKIFNAQCSACHMGGNNVVMAEKTLKKAALEQFGMKSTDAIVTQVTNGKNAMPSFKALLTPEQIQDVAAYVLEQSEKGW